MQKLKMEIEDLRVTSFETDETAERAGTVEAHDFSGFTCPACPTVPTRYGTCCTP